jgi:predicted Zn-dependent protease
VERGKILGRVKNAMINLNIFDKLKDIALSKENIWVSKFISPYIYVPDVSVSSK